MKTVEMKNNGDILAQRLQEFPGLLLDLIFPFMMEYLVSENKVPLFLRTHTKRSACLVSDMGDHPKYLGRADILCRPELL